MFIGEGPGKSEDIVGKAFVGPSGRLLLAALPENITKNKILYFTNTIACRACDEKNGPTRQPEQSEMEACSERVLLTVELGQPKGIIILGMVAKLQLDKIKLYEKYKTIYLPHPSSILKKGGINSRAWDMYCAKLKAFIMTVFPGEN